jgi:hypothetical protein
MTTVDDALKTYTAQVIEAKLLSYLQSAQTPVTDWHEVGFLRSLLLMWAEIAMADVVGPADPDLKHRARLVAGAVPALAARPTDAASRWLTLVADQIFDIRRNYALDGTQFAGTFTQQAVTLFCDASHGPYPIVAGQFWVRSPITGNRYRAITSGTLPNNGSLLITVQAESPNDGLNGQNYADGAGTLTDISDNPLPGVTASNVAPSFSGVTASSTQQIGLGIVTVGGSTPAAPTSYDLQMIASGQVGTATFQYRSNGGPWSGTRTTAASFTIPSGPTVHFTNDPGGSNPSFIAGDGHRFQSPGTAIVQQGLDPETDAALLIRCVGRWPSLEPGRVVDKHETWARAASDLVTRVHISRDDARPGFCNVTIAGTANPLSSPTVAAVQLYIDQHEAISDQSVVAAATVVPIAGSGGVNVSAANMGTVQATAAALWTAYVNSTDIGGSVRAAKLIEVLMDAGAVNVDNISVNFSQRVDLGATEVASANDIITGPDALTWIAV